jgi:hypothetical protein
MNGIKPENRGAINLLQKNANPARPTAIQTATSQQVATLLPKKNTLKRGSYNLTAVFGLIKVLITQLATPTQKEKGKPLNQAHKRNTASVEERYIQKRGHFAQSTDFSSHQNGGAFGGKKQQHTAHESANEETSALQQTALNPQNTAITEAENTLNSMSIEEAFEVNKEKWQQSGIKNYIYTFQRSCFCTRDATREVLTQVKNGQAIKSQFKDSGLPLPAELSFNKLSINDLFNTVETAIDKHVDIIKVKYNEETGQPTSIYIDGKTGITDDEFSLIAKKLIASVL